MDLIEALRAYRLEHQLTQQELAKKLGVSFITVNRWLNGKTHPSELQAYRIKKLLTSQVRRVR
jgi:transcriptional regulator with XRE-family HTH domain